ncbi:MAG: hypothetical protein LBN20_06020 [Endomicrobium sp.]|jgi:hypothetical protein|nr:hypothetical protein [Endomicrobium sp.]
MTEEILYFEVIRGYSKAKQGLRFSVVHNTSESMSASINKGLAQALGITVTEASGISCNIKYRQI